MSAVRTDISYEGTERGAEQIDALLARLGTLVSAEERAAVATNHLEAGLREQAGAASRSATETLDASRANQTFSASAQGMSVRVDVVETKMEAFGSAVGALGGAMQGISPELDALGTGFGHLSAAIGTATAMPGPLGLAMGALTLGFGVYSTATQYAEQQTEALRETALATIPTLDDLISSLNQVNTLQARQSRIGMGLGSVEEQAAAALEAEKRVRRIRVETEETERELRRLRAGSAAERSHAAGVERDLAALEVRGREARADAERLRTLARQTQAEINTQISEDTTSAADEERERREAAEAAARRGRRRPTEPIGETLADLDAEYQIEQAAEAAAARAEAARYQLETEREILALKTEIAEFDQAVADAAKEREDALHAQRIENAERLKDKEEQAARAREDQAREITGRIESTLTTIASAYLDAFGQAIEGQKTLEQASLDATKALLKTIGNEMVALGIKETLEGFANLVSNPPVAATKIPMGVALIAAGVGFGAAGAAIPSAPSAPAERPRGDEERGGGEGQSLTIIYNSPMISAGTRGQLQRQLGRQARDGRGFPTRAAA